MTNARALFFCSSLGLCLLPSAFATAVPAEAPSSFTVELQGQVQDEVGDPLVGAVISVFGKNLVQGALIAVSDEAGQFQLSAMPPGIYQLRAYLSGFLPSAYARVVIKEGMEQVGSLMMSLTTTDGPSELTVPVEDDRERALAELRWLLQHGDRNVLRDEEWSIPAVALGLDNTELAELAEERPDLALREASIGGEFGVRVAAFDDGLNEFPGAGAGLDGRLAYARLFIPNENQDGHWLVSAQVLESALSSWAGRAEYSKATAGNHQLLAGVTYGNYLYGDLEDFRPPEAALSFRQMGARAIEWFGSAYVSDSFDIGSASIHAGVAYEHYSFLDKSGYLSPRMELTYPLGSSAKTVFRGLVDYRVLAPGGEDIGLLSRVAFSDVYGPQAARRSSLEGQRTARVQLGLERQLSERTRVAVRMFQENAADQIVKLYSKDHANLQGAGHFTVRNHGDFRTRGVGLSVSQRFGATEGSVAYTFGIGSASKPLHFAAALPDEEIHDLTTQVATSIDRTRTRVQAAYRFISHPIFALGGQGFAAGSKLDSRFNIQVYQLLPFVGWDGTSWEVMVAVRNLFYENFESASFLDEMAVIQAPRRVLGGVTVRF